jgi:hypothetical protein
MRPFVEVAGLDAPYGEHIWIEDLYTEEGLLKARELSSRMGDEGVYDLCAVVTHKGTSHSGHYHVYARDTLREGKWTVPAEKKGKVKAKDNKKKKEEEKEKVELPPAEKVLVRLLKSCPVNDDKNMQGCMVDELGSIFSQSMKSSWAHLYKAQHGQLRAFLVSRPDLFLVDSKQVLSI